MMMVLFLLLLGVVTSSTLKISSTTSLDIKKWGNPSLGTQSLSKLYQREKDGKTLLVGKRITCDRFSSDCNAGFNNMCILASDPNEKTKPTIWEKCWKSVAVNSTTTELDNNGPDLYDQFIVLRVTEDYLLTCKANLTSTAAGTFPDLSWRGIGLTGWCDASGDLVAHDWLTNKELFRAHIKAQAQPTTQATTTTWVYDINKVLDVDPINGRVIVKAKDIKDSTHHALLVLEKLKAKESITPSSEKNDVVITYAYESPLDQKNTFPDGRDADTCWPSSFTSGIQSKGHFTPFNANLYKSVCETPAGSMGSGELGNVILNVKLKKIAMSDDSGVRYFTSYHLIGTDNEVEASPGGDCFHSSLCDDRLRGRLVTNEDATVSFQSHGEIYCGDGDQRPDVPGYCTVIGDMIPNTDKVLAQRNGPGDSSSTPPPRQIAPCHVSVHSWSNISMPNKLVDGVVVNITLYDGENDTECQHLPEVIQVDDDTTKIVSFSYTNKSQIDVYSFSFIDQKGQPKFSVALNDYKETKGFMTSASAQPHIHADYIGYGETNSLIPSEGQVSKDGSTLLFWAYDNSTVNIPLSQFCCKHWDPINQECCAKENQTQHCKEDKETGTLLQNAAVLIAMDISSDAMMTEEVSLWTQHYDIICDAPIQWTISENEKRRYTIVDNSKLIVVDF